MDTETRVRQLITQTPFLADDDRALLMAFWEAEGLTLTDDQKSTFLELTAAETITRCRRDLVSRGVIEQSPEAKLRRKKARENFRNNYARQRSLV